MLVRCLPERQDRSVSGFDFNYVQPIQSTVQLNYAALNDPSLKALVPQLNVKGGLMFAGVDGGSGLYTTPKNTYLPRFGFAYQLTPKTVIRGGIGVFADRKLPADCLEKLFFRQAVEIAHRSVVSEYSYLRIGEDHGQEVGVVFLSGVRETLISQLGARATGTGGAVMAVGDVEQRNCSETVDERVCFGEPPNGVTNAVFSSDVEQR